MYNGENTFFNFLSSFALLSGVGGGGVVGI